MSEQSFTKWITCPRPNPTASMRLFCLPFAGGGASAYRLWPAALPSSVEVCSIQLPGREDRYREPGLTSLIGLSRALSRELLPFLDKPFAFFGHSMGTLVAFETARALRHSAAPAPLAMFLAAYPAPHLPLARAPIHHLPDDDFIEEMRRMQGTPEAVLGNAELMAFLLPILRADFEACDTYACPSEAPLDCPFFLYGGTEDLEVDFEGLQRWREQTSGAFAQRMFPGTHFFVQSHRAPLLDDIGGQLASLPV